MAIVNDGGGFNISVREELFDTVVEKLNLNLVISIFQLRPVTI